MLIADVALIPPWGRFFGSALASILLSLCSRKHSSSFHLHSKVWPHGEKTPKGLVIGSWVFRNSTAVPLITRVDSSCQLFMRNIQEREHKGIGTRQKTKQNKTKQNKNPMSTAKENRVNFMKSQARVHRMHMRGTMGI